MGGNVASDLELYRQLGRRLKQRRVALHLRQADIADALRLPQSAISKIETGERRIELAESLRIARAYGLEASNLLEIIEASRTK